MLDVITQKPPMYIPKHFEVTDKQEILTFIKANTFGQLISTVDNRIYSSHIPFLLADDNQFLMCHLSKANPQWKDIESQEVLITFQGVHDYISPSWYNSPGVPTWNYQAIHIYGSATIITDTEDLKNIIDDLTKKYESSFNTPWQPEYKKSLLNAIVGIKIKIEEFQGKYKLSQNRSDQDKNQIIDGLTARGSIPLAEIMKNRPLS